MPKSKIAKPVLALLLLTTLGITSAAGQRPPLTMLDQLVEGRWEIRMRGERRPVERVCLRNGLGLIQLRHPEQPCDRLVVEDKPDSVTVQYTCRGRGYGRTHIRMESNQLVQLESQGIAGGLPFDFAAEVRRLGSCDQ
ncbi:hypothetical protein [Novosphingobium sp.]|uniref:hypothetical protein n=1 Tax=Novosphingobium sp. TaxID=1874826 RepID=UPI00286D7261|nr:hypothetical protein [Novosphingobium sp.]